MSILNSILMLASFLCLLTAGFLFAFSSVVMPGIRNLGDREFIRAFQVIDGVIQKGQAAFGMVWMGSVLALLVSTVLGIWQLAGVERLLVIAAALTYGIGVQLPTFAINVPLNNRLQTLDTHRMDEDSLRAARSGFEGRWTRWNLIRTCLACFAGVIQLILLIRL